VSPITKSAESLYACIDFLSVNCTIVYMPSTHVDIYMKIPEFKNFDLSPITGMFKYDEICPWTVDNTLMYGLKLSQEILQLHITVLCLPCYAETTVYETVVEADDNNGLD